MKNPFQEKNYVSHVRLNFCILKKLFFDFLYEISLKEISLLKIIFSIHLFKIFFKYEK